MVWDMTSNLRIGHPDCTTCCNFMLTSLNPTSKTVGQRKKVTAVTFFPARPRSDQRGTNTGQIRKVPVDEIAWCLVYRLDETRSRLSANNGILMYLVREIWQFKVFAGKEVTALNATRGEGGYLCWGRRLLCLCWNWNFFKTLEIKSLRTYTTFEIEQVRTVNYILASSHHDRMCGAMLFCPWVTFCSPKQTLELY